MNIRTVYRYIDSLCASGVPILSDSGHKGGYSLLNRFIEAPLIFDLEEQKALLQAVAFAEGAGYPDQEALSRAADKLKLYTNQKQSDLLNRHINGLEVINRDFSDELKEVLGKLEQASAECYSVDIKYRSKKEEQFTSRLIDPYGILYWNNRWYVIGFCHLREEVRSFRVDRIKQIESTERWFQKPEGFSTGEFFQQVILPKPKDEEKLIPLILMGRTEALDDLCAHWFFGPHLKERTSKRAVFLIDESAMLSYAPYFLLSYGKAIQIIEPLSCRQQLVAALTELLEYYQTDQLH